MAFNDLARDRIVGAMQKEMVLSGSTDAKRNLEIINNRIKIMEKMGLTTMTEAQFFDAEQKRNPSLQKFFGKYEDKMANDPSYDRILGAVGEKFLKEGKEVGFDAQKAASTPTILDALGRDLDKDIPAASSLNKAFEGGSKKTLDAIADNILEKNYEAGKLGQVLVSAGVPQVVNPSKQTVKPSPPGTPPPAGSSTGTSGASTGTPTPPPTGNQGNKSPAPPANQGNQQKQPPAPPQTQVQQPSPSMLESLAEAKDADIKSSLENDPVFIKGIENELIKAAEKNLPKDKIENFRKELNENNGALRTDIAKNLAKNPGLIREMATLIKRAEESKDPDLSNTLQSNLTEIIENPRATLANEQWTSGLSRAGAAKEMLKVLTDGSDAEIRALVQKPEFAATLAGTLADIAREKFPKSIGGENGSVKGFEELIYASPDSSSLRTDIAKNLAQNPDLLREMARLMKDADRNEKTKNILEQNLTRIFEDPRGTLASGEWVKELRQGLKMANDPLGGAFSWLKANLGIDLSGLGAIFQGFFQYIGNFFNQFSGGNFMLMGNLDPSKSLFTKMGEGADNARRFTEDEPHLRGYAKVRRRPGAEGPISDGFTRDPNGTIRREDDKLDENGVIVEAGKGKRLHDPKKDHRVTVTSINGEKHEVFLSDNLSPQRERTGEYTWTVVTGVDKNGYPKPLSQIVVKEAESKKFYAELREAGITNVTDPGTMRTWEPNASQAGSEQPRNNIRVDRQTGQAFPEAAPQQVNYPPAAPSPLRTSPQAHGATPNFNPDAILTTGS
jgi:hypothetical protein